MKTLKQSFLTIAIGLVLIAGISYAWTGPTANPPLNNASAPINVGDSPQIKDGALQVNGFKSIGTSEFVGPAVFKGGTNKDGYTSFFPNSNGKNYIRGTTIIGDSDMDNRVGIGTADPIAKLDLVGNIKITDGTQGEGKVLTSDASGLASWAPIPPPPPQIKTVKKTGGTAYCPTGFVRVGCSGSRQVNLADTCDEDECGYIGTHPIEPNGCLTRIDGAKGTAPVAVAYCLKF